MSPEFFLIVISIEMLFVIVLLAAICYAAYTVPVAGGASVAINPASGGVVEQREEMIPEEQGVEKIIPERTPDEL